MITDQTTPISPETLFAGMTSSSHAYYERNNLTHVSAGKLQMHNAVEEMILNHANPANTLRFLSLPGKFWRFESRLLRTLREVHFTGFESDHRVILSGAAYVPRDAADRHNPKRHGFRCIESLGVEYFKTNRARWLSMDVNSALTLNDSLFWKIGKGVESGDHSCRMDWFLKKFCGWDAAWLDYYGPASRKIGEALANLHFYCRQDSIPVAVTILKGREIEAVTERRNWLKHMLSGGGVWSGVSFKQLDYKEYSDGGSTMCNILGLIQRRTSR